MKRLISLILILSLVLFLIGCNGTAETNIIEFAEIDQYTEDELAEKLIGITRDDLVSLWGSPDGSLSGFDGDFWYLENETYRSIIVYYNNEKVEAIDVTNHNQ